MTIWPTPFHFSFGSQGLKELGTEQERLLRDEYIYMHMYTYTYL